LKKAAQKLFLCWAAVAATTPTAQINKGRSRFLKKAAQKLFLCWAMGCGSDDAHGAD
jgi:hypothetical protein